MLTCQVVMMDHRGVAVAQRIEKAFHLLPRSGLSHVIELTERSAVKSHVIERTERKASTDRSRLFERRLS